MEKSEENHQHSTSAHTVRSQGENIPQIQILNFTNYTTKK